MSVVVFGSINMDLVARTPQLPAPGETVTGSTFVTTPGGKGANQAVAAARLGAQTRMVGRIGDDALGEALRAALGAAGVDHTAVGTAPGSSGVAQIAVDAAGQNTIIVVPGANGLVGSEELARLETALADARVLLLQLEVPLAAVVAAAAAARRRGVTVILDPAPAPPAGLPDELWRLADIITPNEHEAASLLGFPVVAGASAERPAAQLRERTGGAVIIKLGARGAALLDAGGFKALAPFPVVAIDSVAAGDAFNGALAAALAEGQPLHAAARMAMAAAALAVTRPGAQEAMPTRAEVQRLLAAPGQG